MFVVCIFFLRVFVFIIHLVFFRFVCFVFVLCFFEIGNGCFIGI